MCTAVIILQVNSPYAQNRKYGSYRKRFTARATTGKHSFASTTFSCRPPIERECLQLLPTGKSFIYMLNTCFKDMAHWSSGEYRLVAACSCLSHSAFFFLAHSPYIALIVSPGDTKSDTGNDGNEHVGHTVYRNGAENM